MQHGRCLCGDVSGRSRAARPHDPLPLRALPQAHGTPFATYAFAQAGGVRMRAPARHALRVVPGFVRGFCSRCGSVVPSAEVDGRLEIPIGSLTTDPGTRDRWRTSSSRRSCPGTRSPTGCHFRPSEPGDAAPGSARRSARTAVARGRRGGYLQRGALRPRPARRSSRNCHCSRCRLKTLRGAGERAEHRSTDPHHRRRRPDRVVQDPRSAVLPRRPSARPAAARRRATTRAAVSRSRRSPPSTTIRASTHRATSSPARRRRGSRSPTVCPRTRAPPPA